MAFTAGTILELIVFITWTCVSQPVHVNGLFKQLFFDESIVSELCSSASLCFCPGLYETIQAVKPPNLEFFLNLPSDAVKKWGVYALVLEKPGEMAMIYIGSGTDFKRGVPSRWNHYDKPKTYRFMLPEHLVRALDKGYEITHKGLLVSCAIPSAANAPMYRLLFVAMEAALSFLFWTMRSKDKDYGMGACCPWPRGSYRYGGLCSHNALLEKVAGNFDLSPEQLDAVAADIKEKNRLYRKQYNKQYGSNHYYDQKAQDPEGVAARTRAKYDRFKKKSPEKLLANGQRHAAKVKASKKFYCEICGCACTSKWEFERHNTSRRHLNNVKKANSGVVKAYRCDVCSYSFTVAPSLERHQAGKRHLERVAKASA